MFDIIFTVPADKEIKRLRKTGQNKKIKKIRLALKKMMENPRHPGLHTHKYNSVKKASNNEDVFQSYLENKTPGAYRIFWYYGPEENQITILAITPHP